MSKSFGLTKAQKIEQFPRVQRDRDALDLMLHDVMNNAVTFGDWVKDSDGNGKYRVGMADRGYPLAMLVFRCPGQSDSIHVHDAEPWEDELRGLRARSATWEPVVRALASAKDALRARRVADGLAA